MQTITLTNETRRCYNSNAFLGYEGENNANKLVFDFVDGFIDGLAVLKVERGKQKGTIELEKVGKTYELEVKSSLVSVKGDITFQLVITQANGTIIKYDPFKMTVKDAIDTDAELPEEYPSWQEIIATELAKVEEAITNAEEATKKANETSEQLLEDKENGVFNGKDGISPSAKVESTSSGAIITVTDSVGTTTATITNGRDGTDGTNGKDGVSPTIKTEQVEGGTKIIITDVDGTNAATLSNGKNGTNGKDGISPIATVTQITNGATVSITDVNGTTTATIYNGKDGIFKETDPIYIADKPNIALKSELPTKVSELENDSKFISSYTETDPTVPIYVKSITENDISNWNNKSEFSGDYNDLENKPIIPSTEGMVTTEQLTQELSKKQDTLTAGDNITIENNVISAIGGSLKFECTDLISERLTTAGTYTLSDSILNYDEIIVEANLQAEGGTPGRNTTLTIIPSMLELPTNTGRYLLHIADTKATTWNGMACEVLFGFNSDTELVINRIVLGTSVTDRTYGVSHIYGKRYVLIQNESV